VRLPTAGCGTSRHFAAAQQFGRIWSEADIKSQSRIYKYTLLITRAYLPDAAHFRKIQLSHKDNAPRSVALYVPRLPGGYP
jgi:hypothetical protein